MNSESVQENKGVKKVKNYFVYMNECLGKGAFSSVFKGKKKDEGKSNVDVAVKQIDINERTNMKEVKEESKILKSLDHPNIIKLYDTAKTAKHFYLFLELCEKGDLKKFIQKEYAGSVFEKHAKTFFYDILQGYKYLSDQKIVHRDLKLANILITNSYKLKISDFGFAKIKADNEFMMSYKGTPLNMAPEIIFDRNYDYRCDIWSLGTILHELLFAEPFLKVKTESELRLSLKNFKGPIFPENKKNVSAEAKDLITCFLKKVPSERISIENALKHPWFNSINCVEESSEVLLQSMVQQNKKIETPVRKSISKEDHTNYFIYLIKEFAIQELCRKILNDLQEKSQILKEISSCMNGLIDEFPMFEKFILKCFYKIFLITKCACQDINSNYSIKDKLQIEVAKFLESDKITSNILNETVLPEKMKKITCDIEKDKIDILDEQICKGIEKMGNHAAMMEYSGTKNYNKLYEFILLAIKIQKLNLLSISLLVEVNIPILLKECGKDYYLSLSTFPKSLGEIMNANLPSVDSQYIEKIKSKVMLQKYIKINTQSVINDCSALEITGKLEKLLEEKLFKGGL